MAKQLVGITVRSGVWDNTVAPPVLVAAGDTVSFRLVKKMEGTADDFIDIVIDSVHIPSANGEGPMTLYYDRLRTVLTEGTPNTIAKQDVRPQDLAGVHEQHNKICIGPDITIDWYCEELSLTVNGVVLLDDADSPIFDPAEDAEILAALDAIFPYHDISVTTSDEGTDPILNQTVITGLPPDVVIVATNTCEDDPLIS